MNFSMVKICGSRRVDGDIEYESIIMRKGASTPWKNTFENQYEMVSIMNDILTRQKKGRETRHVLNRIDEGEYYFFDLELTEEQAESLGWQRTEDAELVDAR